MTDATVQDDAKTCAKCGASHASTRTQCDKCGSFLTGNLAAKTHGLFVTQQPPELKAHVDDFVAGVVADLGGASEMTTLKRGYVQKLGELELTISLLVEDIARRGLLTPTGHVRSTYPALLTALATFDRLAQRIGLERRAKHIDPIDAVRRAVELANQ